MSLATDEAEVVMGPDAVEAGACRAGDVAGVVAVLAWRRRSMRLRTTCARHLCRTRRSIFEYLNIYFVFEKSQRGQEPPRKRLFSAGPSFRFWISP